MATITQKCSSCGHEAQVEFSTSVDVTRNPGLRARIARGDYFVWECPECGTKQLVGCDAFLMRDDTLRLIILMTGADIQASGLPEGYTGRTVRSPGELVEKLKIFDSGLDDTVVELCKYVTRREMNLSDVELRFVSAGGPDSEMVFAYPKDSCMEMIAVGFNVYEDCAGILLRNPDMQDSALDRLVRIDSAWLSQFLA